MLEKGVFGDFFCEVYFGKNFFGGECREKKFVTFEKINSSKRGGVRTVFEGVVTIMTVVKCFGA